MLTRKASNRMPSGLFHTRTSYRMLARRKNVGVFFLEPNRLGGYDGPSVGRKGSKVSETRLEVVEHSSGGADYESLLEKDEELYKNLGESESLDLYHNLRKLKEVGVSNEVSIADGGKDSGCRSFARRCYNRFHLRHVIPLIVLVMYSLIGAALFYALEVPLGKEMWGEIKGRVDQTRRIVYERIWELHELNLTKEKTIIYAREAINWYEDQIAEERIASGKAIWDFWSAIFYCATIYTTIGYGTIVPITTAGKVLTMLYSIIGIPLVFSILNDFGEFFSQTLFKFWMWCTNHCFFLKSCRVPEEIDSKDKEDQGVDDIEGSTGQDTGIMERLHDLPMSVAFGVTLLWMFLCAALFCTWETDWAYFTAFYFFFVSLTTIGLGDTVPKHLNYMILNFWCVLVGLSLVSMCIQVAQAKVEHLVQEILFGISKKYQEIQVEGEGGMPALDLDRTIDQHPPWMKALIGRRKKGQIKDEWSRRAAMRVKGTQTENDCNEMEIQTDEVNEWTKTFAEQRLHLSTALRNLNSLNNQLKLTTNVNDRYEQALQTLFNHSNEDENMLPTLGEEPIHDQSLSSVNPVSPVLPSNSPMQDCAERRRATLHTVCSLLADTPLSDVAVNFPLMLGKVPPSYAEVITKNNTPAVLIRTQNERPAFETRRKAALASPMSEGSSLLSEVRVRINECRKILNERS